MRWRCLGELAVVLGVAAGCQSDRLVIPTDDAVPLKPDAQGSPSLLQARAQEPDPDGPLQPPPVSPDKGSEPPLGDVAARILAMVGPNPIFEEEVRQARPSFLGTLPDSERQRYFASTGEDKKRLEHEYTDMVLDHFIDREVVLQDAYRRLNQFGQRNVEKLKEAANKEADRELRRYRGRFNLTTEDEIKEFFLKQGTSLEAWRVQREREFMYTEYLRFRVAPALERIGHREIVEFYQQHPEEFQMVDAVQWQDLFVDASRYPSREAARRFAEQLLQRVRTGDDFPALAAQYDNGESRLRKGEGTGRRRGEVRPVEVEAVLFAMRDGDAEIVEISTGYHLVRLVKRDYAGQMPLDAKTQKLIQDKLRSDLFRRESQRLIDCLRRTATIQRYSLP